MVIHDFGESLESELYDVRARQELERRQILLVQTLYLERTILPSLYGLYPDFGFRADDLSGKPAAVTRVRESLNARLGVLQLVPDALLAAKRVFYGEFLSTIALQRPSNAAQYSQWLSVYAKENRATLRRESPAKQALLGTAAAAFQQIGGTTLRVTLQYVVRAMLMVQRLGDKFVALAMAMSTNGDLFEINNFLNDVLFVHPEIKRMMFSESEVPVFERFNRVLGQIQTSAQPENEV
jgi:hypothetical protein